MKTKLTPLALLIPAIVLAQPAPPAPTPQPFQATPPVVNQQAKPGNAAGNPILVPEAGALPEKYDFPFQNPAAAAAYSKAKAKARALTRAMTKAIREGKSLKSTQTLETWYNWCMANYACEGYIYSDKGDSAICVQWSGTACHNSV